MDDWNMPNFTWHFMFSSPIFMKVIPHRFELMQLMHQSNQEFFSAISDNYMHLEYAQLYGKKGPVPQPEHHISCPCLRAMQSAFCKIHNISQR
jgi:hypothetical protein